MIARRGSRSRRSPTCGPAQWSKLIFNATVNAVAALTGLRTTRTSPPRSSRAISATSSTT